MIIFDELIKCLGYLSLGLVVPQLLRGDLVISLSTLDIVFVIAIIIITVINVVIKIKDV